MRGGAMNTVQSAKKPDISVAKKAGSRALSWSGGVSSALKPVKVQFNRLALAVKKHPWAVFAVLLTAAIMEFNYYQARLTREYFRALLISTAQMNGEIDALDAKLNQLSIKIDILSAKLDKLSPPAQAVQAKPRPSIFSKPR
jgi:hypothetical protein